MTHRITPAQRDRIETLPRQTTMKLDDIAASFQVRGKSISRETIAKMASALGIDVRGR